MTRKTPTFEELHTPRPYSEWHEDFGCVLWFCMPIDSPPHCGTPDACDWPYPEEDVPHLWWTPLPDCDLIHERWEMRTETQEEFPQ